MPPAAKGPEAPRPCLALAPLPFAATSGSMRGTATFRPEQP